MSAPYPDTTVHRGKVRDLWWLAPGPLLGLLWCQIPDWAPGVFTRWGYWLGLLSLLLFVVALLRLAVRGKVIAQGGPSRLELLLLLAAAVVVMFLMDRDRDPGAARLVVMAQSQGMYLAREVLIPTRAHEIDGVFTLMEGVSQQEGFGLGLVLSLVHDLLRYRPGNILVLSAGGCLLSLLLAQALGKRLGGDRGGRLGALLALAACLLCVFTQLAWDPFPAMALWLLILLLGDIALERRDSLSLGALGAGCLFAWLCGLGAFAGLVYPALLGLFILSRREAFVSKRRLLLCLVSLLPLAVSSVREGHAQVRTDSVRSTLLSRIPPRGFLVVDRLSAFWIVNGIPATTPERARQFPENFAFHIRNHSFDGILVVQRLDRPAGEQGARVLPGEDLGPAYELSPVTVSEQAQRAPLRVGRLGRLHSRAGALSVDKPGVAPGVFPPTPEEARRVLDLYRAQAWSRLP